MDVEKRANAVVDLTDIYYELEVENKNKTSTTKQYVYYTSALRDGRTGYNKGKKVIRLHKKRNDELLEDLTKQV